MMHKTTKSCDNSSAEESFEIELDLSLVKSEPLLKNPMRNARSSPYVTYWTKAAKVLAKNVQEMRDEDESSESTISASVSMSSEEEEMLAQRTRDIASYKEQLLEAELARERQMDKVTRKSFSDLFILNIVHAFDTLGKKRIFMYIFAMAANIFLICSALLCNCLDFGVENQVIYIVFRSLSCRKMHHNAYASLVSFTGQSDWSLFVEHVGIY